MTTTAARLRRREVRGKLHLDLRNDSERHAGHAGAPIQSESHVAVVVVSDRFRGLSPVQRHQLVCQAVGDMMKGEVHALSIRTLTVDERQGSG